MVLRSGPDSLTGRDTETVSLNCVDESQFFYPFSSFCRVISVAFAIALPAILLNEEFKRNIDTVSKSATRRSSLRSRLSILNFQKSFSVLFMVTSNGM